MTSIRKLLALVVCASLSACASGAKYENMIAAPSADYSISSKNKFYKAITLQEVRGGKETNPLLLSKVGNPEFQSALEDSLKQHSLLSENGTGRYALDAELMALEQPVIGFTFDVDSVVQYKLIDQKKNSIVYDKTIKETGTAKMSDAFVGVTRLRMANENSVKENISSFISDITK